MITGAMIKPGDVVCALPSSGLHTNGYSLARRVCAPLGYDARPTELGGQTLGDALLAIHRPYLAQIEELWSAGTTIKGMAHITGGGLWENVPRILPSGVAVQVQRDTWPMPPIFPWLVAQAGISEHEAYRAFNMGIGMIVIVHASDLERAQAAVPELAVVGAVIEAATEQVQLI
jgi:phosphoribosylformylglycinamidine cyclo-ligase